MHRVLSTNFDPQAAQLTIGGDEAHHAIRVKRLLAGDPLEVLNGAGIVLSGVISAVQKDQKSGEWTLTFDVRGRRDIPPVQPRVEVWSATPKGGHLEEMIEGLSEVGAASWHPLSTIRGVVDPREGKLHRLERVAVEASKQCGRQWQLEIAAGGDLKAALACDGLVIVCDGSGVAFQVPADPPPLIQLLVGPEGGWTPEELAQCRSSGARICRFGPHIMRIETAAVAAAAVILSQASS